MREKLLVAVLGTRSADEYHGGKRPRAFGHGEGAGQHHLFVRTVKLHLVRLVGKWRFRFLWPVEGKGAGGFREVEWQAHSPLRPGAFEQGVGFERCLVAGHERRGINGDFVALKGHFIKRNPFCALIGAVEGGGHRVALANKMEHQAEFDPLHLKGTIPFTGNRGALCFGRMEQRSPCKQQKRQKNTFHDLKN